MSGFTASCPLASYAAHVINQDGSAVNVKSLENKVIGLYFSAHWCGPCRHFTPQLAKRYHQLLEEGENFEIIFISADESEEEALEYFKEMPWKMLHFEQRELEASISKTFQVRGIPSLVLLDAEGNLLTDQGRQAIMETTPSKLPAYIAEKEEKEKRMQQEIAALKGSFNPVSFFGSRKVVDKEGNVIDAATHLKDKVIGIYFSAHWCPPCRGFTPKLAQKYESFIADNKPFEIIFVSSDRDAASATEYFHEMPWKMLDFNDRESKAILAEVFDVSGIPTLAIIGQDGSINYEGREAILAADSFEKMANYAEEQKALKAKLEAEIHSYPDTITIDEHEHPLQKLPSVYLGAYGCDVCGGSGTGWVYHCDECGFDMHPACAMKSFNSKAVADA